MLKHKLTISLNDKIVKTIVIIYKFNTTTNFLNLCNFCKRLLYLETEVVCYNYSYFYLEGINYYY